MARRKIREYHAKRMVAAALGLELKAVLVGPDFNFEMLARDNPWLLTTQLVVKPDMLFGQRGKNNLVLLNVTWEEVMDFLRSRIGDSVTVNGVEGVLSHFIVEPFVAHEGEYYVSLVTDREGVLIHFNALGGVDVEDTWDEHTKDLHIATDSDMTTVDLSPLFAEVGDDDRTAKLDAFVRELFKIFESHDFTTLEINPVVIDEAGQVCMLDLVSELDDTALFMNSRLWGPVDFPLAFGNAPTPEEMYVRELDEKTGASLKLTVLNPEGRIWNLVAGGGASVIFADTVADLGSGDELGSYGEYSGGPNDEETYNYARTLLGLATRNPDGRRRALLVAGGIANFTDIFKTFKGIIHAFGEFKDEIAAANMKIFVRRAGPNYIRGLKSMRDFADESGLDIVVFGPEVTMTHIVPLAVNYINGIDD